LFYLLGFDMVILHSGGQARLLQTMSVLAILFIFFLTGETILQAQEIIKFDGPDGKKVYSNTEQIYGLPGNASFTPELTRAVNEVIEIQASQTIDNLIYQISERHGIDPDLVKAVARVESNYNAYAVSRKGALGLMQLIPETAKRFGVNNIFDARQNIEGGVKFLKFLTEMFPNNLPYILAAYNAGEKAVLKYRGIPPYRETRAYVIKTTNLYNKKGPFLTAKNESDGSIVRYCDKAGRVVYSNVGSAY
jgi:Transglycosylase SLT domain